jgi:5'-nucleotidase
MKKILYIDMDNVLVNFSSAFKRLPEDVLKEYEGRPDDIPGIFALMDPMADAVDAFKELVGLFDTYILSTSPWRNPSAWSDKLLWVKKYLGDPAHKRLIISHHKNLSYGDFLVDDRTVNGADCFAGELILFGSDLFPNWASVIQYLRIKQSKSGA